jgi:hypothetical protein
VVYLFGGDRYVVERALGVDGNPNKVPLALLFFVRDVAGHCVVFIGGAEVSMKLIDGFDSRQAL